MSIVVYFVILIATVFLTLRFIPSKGLMDLGDGKYVVDWRQELQLVLILGVALILQFIELIWLNIQKPLEQVLNIFWLSYFIFQIGLRGISNFYQLQTFSKEMSQLVYTINLFSNIFLGIGFLALGIYAYKVSQRKSKEKLTGIIYTVLAIIVLFHGSSTFISYLWNPVK